MSPATEPDGPQESQLHPPEPGEAEEVDGELVDSPRLRRAIELSVQQNIQQHLHLRERDLLPDPEELRRFDQIVPGLAARVADEWQKESGHRREMDKTIADGQLSGYRRYQWFAFLLILALLGVSAYLFSIDKDVIAFLLALTTAISVVVRALLAMASTGAPSDDEGEEQGPAATDDKEAAPGEDPGPLDISGAQRPS
jgi:uncharacterized membrane protein